MLLVAGMGEGRATTFRSVALFLGEDSLGSNGALAGTVVSLSDEFVKEIFVGSDESVDIGEIASLLALARLDGLPIEVDWEDREAEFVPDTGAAPVEEIPGGVPEPAAVHIAE